MVSQGSDFFSCQGLPVNYPLVPEAPQPAPQPGPQPPGRACPTASARRPGPLSPTCCALRAGPPGSGGAPFPTTAGQSLRRASVTAQVPPPGSQFLHGGGGGGSAGPTGPAGTVTHPHFVNKSPGSLQERQAPCCAREGGREGGGLLYLPEASNSTSRAPCWLSCAPSWPARPSWWATLWLLEPTPTNAVAYSNAESLTVVEVGQVKMGAQGWVLLEAPGNLPSAFASCTPGRWPSHVTASSVASLV